MDTNYTEIAMVLDCSSSMDSVRGETIKGVNAFLDNQKIQPGEAKMTLVTFATTVNLPLYEGRKIQECAPLSMESYVPNGWTALLDAIGRTINSLGARLKAMPEHARPAKVIVVIVTDGEENKSVEFNRAQINEMIKHQTEVYRWEFMYIGANQDAIQVAAAMSIPAGKAMNYAANAVGTQRAFVSAAKATSAYRTTGLSHSAVFDEEDRANQADAGANH